MKVKTRQILLLDCDAMFCEVARMADKEGAGKAKELIVGGSRGDRGVVCSASYGARDKGVHAGMPLGMAARLCPEAMLVPVPRREVAEKSRQVEEILRNWSPDVEAASVDEFYIDMSGMDNIYPGKSLLQIATDVRKDVMLKAGIPVSLGGASNKMLAKMAVEMAKPRKGGNGTFVLGPGQEKTWMSERKLYEIPGVGPKAQERYKDEGLESVADVLEAGLAAMKEAFSSREAEWLWSACRGEDHALVEPAREAKSISHETTFSRDTREPKELAHYLKALSSEVAAECREAGVKARTITVKMRSESFKDRQKSKTVTALNSDGAIYKVAKELLERLKEGNNERVRLLGVVASKFVEAAEEDLWPTDVRDRQVSELLDRIRQRHGKDSVGYGAQNIVQKNM